ncbi:hypothetical protein K3495_g16208, partial [Podosphaera aphanis]
PGAWDVKTSEDLLNRLDRQYETVDLAHDATLKFDLLSQGNRPFQNFLSSFMQLAKKSNKTEEQMVDALKKKVSPEITNGLRHVTSPPARSDFAGWSNLCQTLYNNNQEYDHHQRFKAKSHPQIQLPQNAHPQIQPPHNVYQQPQQSHPIDSAIGNGDPMQLDAMREVERKRCIDQGLCFYCKVFGHLVEDCRSKKAADERNAHRGGGRGGRGSFFGRASRGTNFSRGRGQGSFQARVIEEQPFVNTDEQEYCESQFKNMELNKSRDYSSVTKPVKIM